MKGKCCNCSKVRVLEKHHIVPVSRGGTEEENNLTFLCGECHGKAHNVSFRGKDGLIKTAMDNKNKFLSHCAEWVHNNEDYIGECVAEMEPELAEVYLTLLEYGSISVDTIYQLCNGEDPKDIKIYRRGITELMCRLQKHFKLVEKEG